MIRILWGVTAWGSATPSLVTATTAESWAFPVHADPVLSHTTLCYGVPDLVAVGHIVSL